MKRQAIEEPGTDALRIEALSDPVAIVDADGVKREGRAAPFREPSES